MLAAATQAYSQSTSGSCDGATGSSHSSAPPVDTNQIWYEAVDGKEKMPVYGVGSSTSSFYSRKIMKLHLQDHFRICSRRWRTFRTRCEMRYSIS